MILRSTAVQPVRGREGNDVRARFFIGFRESFKIPEANIVQTLVASVHVLPTGARRAKSQMRAVLEAG